MRNHLVLKVGIFLGGYAGGYALGAIHEWWAWAVMLVGVLMSGILVAVLEDTVKREASPPVVGRVYQGTRRG